MFKKRLFVSLAVVLVGLSMIVPFAYNRQKVGAYITTSVPWVNGTIYPFEGGILIHSGLLPAGSSMKFEFTLTQPMTKTESFFEFHYSDNSRYYYVLPLTTPLNQRMTYIVAPYPEKQITNIYYINRSGLVGVIHVIQINDGTTEQAYEDGHTVGYTQGYQDGYLQGQDSSSVVATFIPQIFGAVGSFFVTTFSGITLFGISLWQVVLTITAVLLVVFFLKFIT